jgi:tetratricopeptide (TPR) repeat protein
VEVAAKQFKDALTFDPTLTLNPEAEARRLAALALVEEGYAIAAGGRMVDLEEAIKKFDQALAIEPGLEFPPLSTEIASNLAFVYSLHGDESINNGDYEQAVTDYSWVIKLSPDDAEAHNSLCWYGSLTGAAAEVMTSCQSVVELAPDNGEYRDSRGLARALTGDYSGAIEDFEFFIAWLKETGTYEEGGYGREAWIAALQDGQNPFDEATLANLLHE